MSMFLTDEMLAELVEWAEDGRFAGKLIGRLDGRDPPEWARDEFELIRMMLGRLNGQTVSRETRGTKNLASLPPASRKRVMEAKAACEKRVKEMDVSARRKRRKAA